MSGSRLSDLGHRLSGPTRGQEVKSAKASLPEPELLVFRVDEHGQELLFET